MAKGTKSDVLYRVVKFEIKPTSEELTLLRRVSDNLWFVWNEALEQRVQRYKTHVEPLYEKLKVADADTGSIRAEIKQAFKEHAITLFDQINALTPRRARDEGFASVTRNWQEETLDTLNGAFSSFMALRHKGDPSARTPRERNEHTFCEIPGRSGFKLGDGAIILSCGKLAHGSKLTFPIPEEYQGQMLARATRVKKFTLYRDHPDMRQSGRFWISIAYEMPQPCVQPFIPEQAVYVALGASSIGILSPKGEEVLPLWRADKYWKPSIDDVDDRLKRVTKGSRAWKRRTGARQKMFHFMSEQQKLNRREIVSRGLLSHGVHFVVTDLVVRSKKGKLADGQNQERGGSLGLNWSAQNTGSIGFLVEWLSEKVREQGGTVRKHKLVGPFPDGQGHEVKLPMVRLLREQFLQTQTS